MSMNTKCARMILRKCIKAYFSQSSVTKNMAYDFRNASSAVDIFPQVTSPRRTRPRNILLAFSIIPLLKRLGIIDDKEEHIVVQLIRRGDYSAKRGKNDIAEQIYHVALKVARDLHDEDCITYLYDRVANLALTTEQYNKVITVFTEVLRRLFENGAKQDDLAVIHISLKMSQAFAEMKETEKALTGLQFCYDNLQPKVEKAVTENDTDVINLWLFTLYDLGQVYYDCGQFKKSVEYFKMGYSASVAAYGEVSPESITFLRDLALAHCMAGEVEKAHECVNDAIKFGRQIEDYEDFPSIYVTLGYIYMKEKEFNKAREACMTGLEHSKRLNNDVCTQESLSCLDLRDRIANKMPAKSAAR